MAFEVYIWSILLLLILTAVGAKVLTSNLLVRQKRQVVELTAKKQGTMQRQQAVHKRLESLKSTLEMTVRRKQRLTDEIDGLKDELGGLEQKSSSGAVMEEEEEAYAEEDTAESQETAAEEVAEEENAETQRREERKIKTQFDKSSSLFDDSKKPRQIATYLDKIRGNKDKPEDSSDS
jgi:hypothetical protein